MSHRLVFLVLLALLALAQAQLWFGRGSEPAGSLPEVRQMQRQLDEQRALNEKARLENEQLAVELEDLKSGLGAVEERARTEQRMIRPNEIFVQFSTTRP